MAPRLYGAGVALMALMALAGWLAVYPFGPWLAGVMLAVYMALILIQPALWLVVLPALWPVIDLAPWSGQIHLNESDALALATLAGLGLRELLAPPPPTLQGRAPVKLRVGALVCFGLLATAVAVATLRGLQPFPPLDAAGLVGYGTPLNSLRVAKGYVLAFALIPFLHLAIRRDGEVALHRFAGGVTLGLGACALGALWERMAFPGLTNFSADYRSAALFWEMHVGGAALDAWLSMTFPFALAHLRSARSRFGRVVALILVGLGSYALFTTFSRIVYASVLVAGAVLALAAWRHPARRQAAHGASGHLLVLIVLAAAGLAGCALAFQAGGYRGMAAFAGLLLLAYLGGGALRADKGTVLTGGGLAGLLLGGVTGVLAWWLPKGVYVVFGLAWCITALILVGGLRGRLTAPPALVAALLAWLAVHAALVSVFWGEAAGLPGLLLAVGLVGVVLIVQVAGRRPLWIPRLDSLHVVAGGLVAGGMVVATLASAYMGSRMATTEDAFKDRATHFRHSLGLVHDGAGMAFGLGLGRYPDAYFWNVPDPGVPGFMALQGPAGQRYMQLGGERRTVGSGEHLHLTQRIELDPRPPFQWRARLRTLGDIQIVAAVCRKNLLYPEDCTDRAIVVKGTPQWQDVEMILDGQTFRAAGWPPRPAALVVTVLGKGPVDFDELQLFDGRLRSLLRNGDFERGSAFWFFSSDHDHLPWHAKNVFLQTYVEQGLLGLAALVLALAAAGGHLAGRPTRGHPLAPVLLASLAGGVTVGLVDSLVDMPRITLLLMLILWLGLTLRRPPDQAPP